MHVFRLIRRRRRCQFGNAAVASQVKAAAMRPAISSDLSGPAEGKPHRKFPDCRILDDLVQGALWKCRINRQERFHPVRCGTGGESHRVLFGRTDVKCAVSKL